MSIKSLRVQNFRAHEDFSIEFSEKATLISGLNGSGKTSLLEAVFIAFRGTSFRSSDREIVKNDSDHEWFRIDLEFNNGNKRVIKYDKNKSAGKKQFSLDGKITYRLLNSSKLPVVLFEPDDLQLLSGSPARRRRFIDGFLAQIYPDFSLAQTKYEKALKQRNNLLKKDNFSSDEIFPWNLMLAQYGSHIINRRCEFIELLNSKINPVYTEIAGTNDKIEIIYDGDWLTHEEFLRRLSQNEAKDRILGFTSLGPHRHDLIFNFNHAEAVNVASRGEVRSLVLALKFMETDVLSELTGKKPIVLLDDVFSELDEKRQNLLAKHFSKYQTIISSVNEIKRVDISVKI